MDHDDARRRYLSDPVFRNLVDMMVHTIRELQFSPGEIREAAIFADIKFQQLRPSPTIVSHDGIFVE